MSIKKEIIKVGQVEIKFLLNASGTNGQLAIFEFMVPAGAKVPLPHYHESYDETIYGLEGIMTLTVDGNPINLEPGQSCFVPRGIVHGFNNLNQQSAKALAIATPGLIGPEYFRDVAEIVNAGGPPEVEKLKLVFKKHGLVPVRNE